MKYQNIFCRLSIRNNPRSPRSRPIRAGDKSLGDDKEEEELTASNTAGKLRRPAHTGRDDDDSIGAIGGYACVYPIAETVSRYRELFQGGRTVANDSVAQWVQSGCSSSSKQVLK